MKLLIRGHSVFFNLNKLYHLTLQKGCHNLVLHQTCVLIKLNYFPEPLPAHIIFFYFCQFEGQKKRLSHYFSLCFPVCFFVYISSSGNYLFHLLLFFFLSIELFILSHTFFGAPCLRDMNPLCYVWCKCFLSVYHLSLFLVYDIFFMHKFWAFV